MAVSDYNKKKDISPTSQNDSGATINKAQPVLVKAGGLSSASYTGTSISTQDGIPTGIAFNDDGTKMFEVGSDSNLIYEYSLSTAYDISTASYTGTSISTQDGTPRGIAFSNDGTKMFEVGSNSDLIYEYSLSTAYDISTATFQNSISTQDTGSSGIVFSNDGSKMFEVGFGSDLIYEYSLSTAYDISTATFQNSISTQDGIPRGIVFNDDGSKMFEVGSDSDLIYEYSLSTAYDISTASYTGTSISTQDTAPTGIVFSNDGSKMFEVGSDSDLIYEYNILTAGESKTGTGDIILDWTNISSESDIAMYDQNGNLLPYEIESFDATAETAVLWCWNSWVRDDTVQAQVVYGDGPTSSEEDVSGTWDNTGQNAVMVQHLQDDPLTATDSTANNNDGTVNGAVSTSGQFDGAGSWDGNDDIINIDSNLGISGSDSQTLVVWETPDDVNSNNTVFFQGTGSSDQQRKLIHPGSSDSIGIQFFGDDLYTSQTINAGEAYQTGFTYDGNNRSLYIDGSVAASDTPGSTNTTDENYAIGADPEGPANLFDGVVSELRVYSDFKSTTWWQAEYDASPKAGQVFFSQSAAEDTTTTVSQTAVDSLGFSENTQDSVILTLTTSDSVAFTENFTGTLQFTTTDSLGFNEAEATQLADTLSDQLTFAETTQQKLLTTLTDDLGFKENTAGQLIDTLEDSLAFNELANATLALTVTVSDSLTFGEATDKFLKDKITEQLGLSENLDSVYIDTLSDDLKLEENTEKAIVQKLTDSLVFNEATSTDVAVILADQLNFTENTASQLQDIIQEELGFSEEVAGGIATTLSDQLSFQDTSEKTLKDTLRDSLVFEEAVAGELADTITEDLSFQEQFTFAALINIRGLTQAIITNKDRFVSMQNHTFKEGDFGDELNATLEDRDGAVDLSQVQTVDVVAENRKGEKVQDSQATITGAKDGQIEYVWQSGDIIETAGIYRMEFRVTDSAGNTETFPNDGYLTVEIEEEIS